MSFFAASYWAFAAVFGGFTLGYMAATEGPPTARRVAFAVAVAYLWPVVIVCALWAWLFDSQEVKP